MTRWTRDYLVADKRSDDELIATAVVETQLPEEEFEAATGAFFVLLWRSGPELLQRAIALTQSADWMERELGVDLLGQIHDPGFRAVEEGKGWQFPALLNGYLEETIPVLLALVESEVHPDVVDSLAWAFGAREDPRGVAPLALLATDERQHIRFASTRSLAECWHGPENDADSDQIAASLQVAKRVASAFVVLADDADGDIRDWALFGLAQLELDTEEIRATFLAHLEDPHHDAMTEAYAGIANLGDPRGIEPLRLRIENGEDATPLIEACEQYGDPRLVPVLQALRDDDFEGDDDEIDAALATCRPGLGWQGPHFGWWAKLDGRAA